MEDALGRMRSLLACVEPDAPPDERRDVLDAARERLLDARRAATPLVDLRVAFGDLVAAAAADEHHAARAVAPAAAEDACQRDLAGFIGEATPVFEKALQDPHPFVRMRAVRSVTSAFRRVMGLAWSKGIGQGPEGASGAEDRFTENVYVAWIDMHLRVLSFLDDEHDGVANAAVKFADAAALALSYSGSGSAGSADFFTLDYAYSRAADSPSVDVATLQKYGKAVVSKLEVFVRSAAVDTAGNVIRVIPFTTAVTALGNLSRRRKLLMELALPPLLAVASEIVKEDEKTAGITSLSKGQRSSIIMVLRLSLQLLSTYSQARIGQVARDLAAACTQLSAFEAREYKLVLRKHQAQKEAKRAAAAAALPGGPVLIKEPPGMPGQPVKRESASPPPPLATGGSLLPSSGLSQLLAQQRTKGKPPPPTATRGGRGQDLPRRMSIPKRPRVEAIPVSAARPDPEAAAMGAMMLMHTMRPDQLVKFIMAKLQEGPPDLVELQRREKRPRTAPPEGTPSGSNGDGSRGSASEERAVGHPKRAPSRRMAVPTVVARKLSDDARHRLLHMQCRRILKSESRAKASGAAPLRLLALSRLLTIATAGSIVGAKKFEEEVVTYVVDNLSARIELALAWLHAEAARSFESGGCCELKGRSDFDEKEAALVVARLTDRSGNEPLEKVAMVAKALEASPASGVKDEPALAPVQSVQEEPPKPAVANQMVVDTQPSVNERVDKQVVVAESPAATEEGPKELAAKGGETMQDMTEPEQLEAKVKAGDKKGHADRPDAVVKDVEPKETDETRVASPATKDGDSKVETNRADAVGKEGVPMTTDDAAVVKPVAEEKFTEETNGVADDVTPQDADMQDVGEKPAVANETQIVGVEESQETSTTEMKNSDVTEPVVADADVQKLTGLATELSAGQKEDQMITKVDEEMSELHPADMIEVEVDNFVVEGEVQLGSRYEALLNLMLKLAASKLEPEDRLFSRLLIEAPTIPDSSLALVVADCRDAARSRLGLTTLRDIVLERPGPDRNRSLSRLLQFTIDEDDILRGPSIRLVVSKLYEDMSGSIPERVEAFAIKSLSEAVDTLQPASADVPEADVANREKEDSSAPAAGDASLLERNIWLFTALCAKKESLLSQFAIIYSEAPVTARPIVLARAKDVAGQLGPECKELVALVRGESAPYDQDSKDLVDLAVALTAASMAKAGGLPPDSLVDAVRQRYDQSKDARLLLTILTGLQRNQLLSYLPVLVKMEGDGAGDMSFQAMITKVMTARPRVLDPDDLLVELHMLPCDRHVCAALKTCFEMTGIFKHAVVATALQKTLDASFIPELLMRTVLLARGLYPRLDAYIRETVVLGTHGIIRKRVWENEKLWKGFVHYCGVLQEQSLVMLVRLPEKKLVELLTEQPALSAIVKETLANKKTRINRRDRSFLTVAQEKASL